MEFGLKDRVAIVTGASRGIGRATAAALAAEGASLALCSRKEAEIRQTAEDLASRYHVRVHAEACDMMKFEEIDGFIRSSVDRLGRVDTLVNNVGASLSKKFDELADDDWQEVVEKNLYATLRCSRAVVPLLITQGGGTIVNIAALSGLRPRVGQIASNAVKAAIVNFTQSLSWEVGPHGIRVNAVCPAAILTERWEARVRKIADTKKLDYETALRELARSKIPVGRFGTPEDVAHLVTFLASNKSDYINGVAIEVDGGLGRCVDLEIK